MVSFDIDALYPLLGLIFAEPKPVACVDCKTSYFGNGSKCPWKYILFSEIKWTCFYLDLSVSSPLESRKHLIDKTEKGSGWGCSQVQTFGRPNVVRLMTIQRIQKTG